MDDPSSERIDGHFGKLKMLVAEGDADYCNIKKDSEKSMSQCNPDASAYKPENVHEDVKAA